MWQKVLDALMTELENHPEQVIALLNRVVDLVDFLAKNNPEVLKSIVIALKGK